jgi:signal transduction histidine kinase/ActR/RegA family two-component response regulator
MSLPRDERILVLMPTYKDSLRTGRMLHDAGMAHALCKDLAELCQEIRRGAAAALLPEEVFGMPEDACLRDVLDDQPPWSDFPLIVLAKRQERGQQIREAMNATLVEPPLRWRSLLSVLRAALRSRRHQYTVRNHLAERQRVEEALFDSQRKKDDFIALLAHELRNPLAPIRNGLQVLRLAGHDAEMSGQAQDMMERQLTHMVRLIDDLLDVSRIGRNKMELRRQRVSIAEVLNTAVETARPVIDAGGHALEVSIPSEPIVLEGDLTRLAQVFSNLLTNSAKYTERGGRIAIVAERTPFFARVTVRDTGIGIPRAELETIFDMFSQVDRSIERSTGGLGIGLALVKGLVEAHGGAVKAVSDGQGLGSTFIVTLPVMNGDGRSNAIVAAKENHHAASRRILVVDDNRDGAQSLSLMLTLLGNEVCQGHDGLEAVRLAESYRPEVIFMDVGMPLLNGYEATARIRLHDWGNRMYIIAVTGWGQDSDRELSRQAGCDGHLVKPVHLSDLQRKLSELDGSRKSPSQ